MKKYVATILLLTLALAGCSSDSKSSDAKKSDTKTTSSKVSGTKDKEKASRSDDEDLLLSILPDEDYFGGTHTDKSPGVRDLDEVLESDEVEVCEGVQSALVDIHPLALVDGLYEGVNDPNDLITVYLYSFKDEKTSQEYYDQAEKNMKKCYGEEVDLGGGYTAVSEKLDPIYSVDDVDDMRAATTTFTHSSNPAPFYEYSYYVRVGRFVLDVRESAQLGLATDLQYMVNKLLDEME